MGKASASAFLVTVMIGLSLVAPSSAGSITLFNPVNAVSTGGISVTISGLDFGTTSYTPTVDLGSGTSCATTSWTSVSTVNCLPQYSQYGTGSAIKPYFRGQSTYTSVTDYFTFDAPAVSYALSPTSGKTPNGPQSGDGSVTISGLNFAAVDATATVSLRANCKTTSWTSMTTLSCMTGKVSAPAYLAETVTITGHTGTFQSGLYSFDAPALSYHKNYNSCTSGGAILTVMGLNFGPVDYTPTAHIGGELSFSKTICMTTSWSTDTAVRCAAPASFGRKQFPALTISGVVGTRPGGHFSYDKPVPTHATPGNAPPLATSAYVTIFGLNFAPVDATATAFINNNANLVGLYDVCTTTSWSSGTAVTCMPNERGADSMRSVAVGGLGQSGTGGAFTYDGPIITSNFEYNQPSSGGTTVTISGLNFGYVDATPESYVGLSYCQTTSWSSATTVQCQMPTAGAGTNAIAMGRIFNVNNKYFGTLLSAFTFDAPTVSFGTPGPNFANMPVTGGLTLSVSGFNFGKADFSSTGSIGLTTCATLSWKSATSIDCVTPVGAGMKKKLTVTVGAVVGTLASRFSFDAPSVTYSYPSNGPSQTGYMLTLDGQNYASANLSPSARLGGTACASTQWISTTQIKCVVTSGFKGNHLSAITVEGIVGTRAGRFTFDAPVPTHLKAANTPTTGGTSVTMLGMSFGSYDFSATAAIDPFDCKTTSWTTSSSITCLSSAGTAGTEPVAYGVAKAMVITVGAIVGTRTSKFTYDSPAITSTGTNLPTTNGATLTVFGLNFGYGSTTPTTFLGDDSTACSTTSWTTVSTVRCASAGGSGPGAGVQTAMLASIIGTGLAQFTFDAPTASFFTMPNAPTTGGVVTTVGGINFGISVLTSTIRLGSSRCTTVSWSSATALQCTATEGYAVDHSAAITVSSMIGTVLSPWSYDSPSITYARQFNTPTCGDVSVTIQGVNFGGSDLTASLTIGETLCSSTQWASNTAIKCSTPSGFGPLKHVALTVASLVGTASSPSAEFSGFTYDAPVVSFTVAENSATSSGGYVTLTGFNFAQSSATLTISIDTTVCASTSWTSQTSVYCTTPAGSGSGSAFAVTLSNQVWSKAAAFTYDSPVVSVARTYNLAVSTGSSLTVLGVNFGSYDPSATTLIGNTGDMTQCTTTSWNTQTSLTCAVTAGADASSQSILVTVASNIATGYLAFSYDSPVISGMMPYNGIPTAAGQYMGGASTASITVVGSNFATYDPSPTVGIQAGTCTTSSWVTNSHVLCVPTDSAGGANRFAKLTIAALVGTYTSNIDGNYGAFTFDAPNLSYNAPASNLVTTAGASVTLWGFNFGGLASTPTVHLGKTMCHTTSWTSDTQLTCTSPYGSGAGHEVVVSISEQVGTRLLVFSYDSPTISIGLSDKAGTNGPTSGGTVVTVVGMNLFNSDLSPTAGINSNVCMSTSWSSSSSISCIGPVGHGKSLHISATLSAITGTSTDIYFSYDAPVLSHMDPANSPSSGSSVATMVGINFGGSDITPTVGFGLTQVGTVTWTTYSSVRAATAHGVSQGLNGHLVIASLVGTTLSTFSYDAPTITGVTAYNAPSSGASITIAGINFGSTDSSSTATTGATVCACTSFVSHTSAVCLTPAGVGTGHFVGLSVSSLVGTKTATFSFDSPVLTSLAKSYNGPTCGGTSVSLSGFNFGMSAVTATGVLAEVACPTSAWTTYSNVMCLSPSGYGAENHAKISISELVSTLQSAFTFDGPVITDIQRNAPTLSSATLSLMGINFASSDRSVSVNIGSSACKTSSWVSTTMVLCRQPDGLSTGHSIDVEVASLLGTLGGADGVFSYDSPVVTFLNKFNSPTTAAASLTVLGTNFGMSDATPSVVIGLTYCVSTSWTTESSVKCSNADGYGTTEYVAIIVSGLTGTNEDIFTYDSPVVTYADVVNSPVSGDSSLTLTGVNFASTDLSAIGRIGLTACTTTSYVSDTSVLCQGGGGSGAGLNNMVTVSSLVGTREDAFSFDTPIISHYHVRNIATTALSTITLLGTNFGLSSLSETVVIGSTKCLTSSWTTLTSVYCTVRPGIGAQISSTIDVNSLIGTRVSKFTFDSPVITSLILKNGATSGSASVTLVGMNFGMQDYTLSAEVASVSTLTASWISETQVVVSTAPDSGEAAKAVLVVQSLSGTINAVFSFDSPIVTSHTAWNMATTGVGAVTLHGSNFGTTDPTVSVRIGSTQCTTAIWLSSTAATCASQPGIEHGLSVSVTITSLVGTSYQSFSYDAPAATYSVLQNGAISGSTYLTVMGLNFANVDQSATLKVGLTTCGTTAWSSSTALTCHTLGGLYEADTSIRATMLSPVSGTLLASFSYDAPTLSQSNPPNLATSTGSSVTIHGFNFGKRSPSPTAAIGQSACSTAGWKSDTTITCFSKFAGAGPNIRSVVTLSSIVGTVLKSFTYDSPAVSYTNLYNSPTCGLYSVTLSGFNFATSNYTPSSQIGSTTCRTTSWTSVTSVACELAAGNGVSMASSISTVGLIGTSLAAFTYDAPIVSFRNTDNGPTSGGTSITLTGTNYGMSNTSPSAIIGSSHCQSSMWVTDTSLVCLSPAGSRTSLDLVVTVGNMISTTMDTYSYDSPVITFTDLFNMPTTAGGQVTVVGQNFGFEDWTPSTRIGTTLCGTTQWSTTSSVMCVAASGYGIARRLTVSIAPLVGTVHGLFSYDSPMVTGLTLGNSATTGGKSVTIQGGNFAIEDGTLTALVGTSMCATTSWTSSSVVSCLLGGASAGADFQVAVTLVGLVGTKQKVFTFDSPAISFTYQFNSPLSGYPSITLSGTNFASQDYSMDAYIGKSTCLTTSWMTVTSAKCLVGPGFSQGLTSTLTVSSLIGTRNAAFSYDPPTVTYATTYNAPVSAGISVTLSGTNFGAQDYSVTVQVAETACLTSKWVSMTSATCELAQGVGVGPTSTASEHRVAITVGTGVGTRTRSFTFDAPVVTYAARFNAASTGGQSVTVNGVNFGLTDYSVTVGIGKTACMTTTWSSNTGMLCAAPAGGGYGYQIAVTAMGIDGTLASMFTYDAPVVTRTAVNNGPTTGNAAITLHGTGFGLADNTPSVYIALTSCGSASWTTLSSVICYTPLGTGSSEDIALTVTSMVGTEQMAFTYDAPALSQMLGENGPITGGASVTLAGTNFGLTDLTPSGMIGGTLCASTMWVSGSAVRCATSLEGGYGSKKSGMLMLSGLVGTVLNTFTYDSPTISIAAVTNGPSTTGARVTISGSDFGQMDLTPTARVGKTRCATTSWMSSTSLSCSLASGAGSTLHAGVALFGLEATLADVFTYDSPVITSVSSTNAPTVGGATLTITGTSFGAEDFSATARIGSTSCTATEWLATTSVNCVTPAGGLTSIAASLTVAGTVGTQVNTFSYDGPVITALYSANAPLSGSAPISLMGMNFVQSDRTPSATVMNSVCLTTSWTADSVIQCRSISGYGTAKVAGLTIDQQVATFLAAFTFDGPVLTDIAPPNFPSTGGSSVTVFGLNFVSDDVTPTLRIATTVCSCSSWSTATSVTCAAGAITGTGTQSVTLEINPLIVGTNFNGFSYDAPVSSYAMSYNGATSGGSSVTVNGFNFATSDTSPTIRIGGAACETSSWVTSTVMYCMNSPASGVAQSVAVEVDAIVGSFSNAFTYDAPTPTHSSPLNSAQTGGASVSIFGTNFGMNDFTVTVQIGLSTCATAAWTSTTQVVCSSAVGYQSTLTGVLLVSGMIGTHTAQTFTYDSPVVTYSSATNAPTTSGASITVEGINFYGEDLSATILIGGTVCKTSSWTSNTALACFTSDGAGTQKSVVIMQDTLIGTQFLGFSYDSPLITAVNSPNAPTSGSSMATILGMNFGASDMSLTAKIGATTCASTDWNSETSVLCLMPVGFGIKRTVEVILDSNSGSLPAGFTYDTAVLTRVAQNNAPAAGLASVTLSGFNFVDQYDPTPSVRLGATGCTTASWSSVSAIVCQSPIGTGVEQLVSATLGQMVGSLSSKFTFDSPAVTVVSNPNIPSSAGTSLTVSGMNFGMDASNPAVTIGGIACDSVNKFSDTSIVCKPAAASGNAHSVVLSTEAAVGTLFTAFTYDAPTVTFVKRFNAPTSGGASITLLGVNLGVADHSTTVKIAGTKCATSMWKSDTSVVCLSKPGTGDQNTVSISVTGITGTGLQYFSYDAPVVTSSALVNAAGSGQIYVTVTGTNFANLDTSGAIKLGATTCGTASWSSGTSLKCKIENSGNGIGLKISANADSMTGTGLSLFSYDAPMVTFATRANAATTAGTIISISGANFGHENFSGTAYIGATACDLSTYITNSLVSCTVPQGSGQQQRVTFSRDGIMGTMSRAFSYDSPIITYTALANGPAKSGASLMVEGTNFGPQGTSPTVLVGISWCTNSEWVSTTSLKCTTPDGTSSAHNVNVVVTGLVGTRVAAFTYDSPELTGLSVYNGPMVSGAPMTLFGKNFGNTDNSATVSVGSTACADVSWGSDSSIVCTTPSGATTGETVKLSLGSFSAEGATFSHDAPLITHLDVANGPTAGGATVTLFGTNFGAKDMTLTASIGGVACSTSQYVSDNSALCSVAAGGDTGLNVSVQVGVLVATVPEAFSYDKPSVTSIAPTRGYYIGRNTVTVFGTNFGSSTSNAAVSIGGTACLTTAWVSSVALTCSVPPATEIYVKPRSVTVTIGGETSTLPDSFSYSSPDELAADCALNNCTVPAFNLTADSVTIMQVGPTAGQPGVAAGLPFEHKYQINGTVGLAGRLHIVFEKGMTPPRTQCWEFFSGTGFTGTFDKITTNIDSLPYDDEDWSSLATVCTRNTLYSARVAIPGCDSAALGYTDCSGHGTCNAATGYCTCDDGYGGAKCDSVCFYNASKTPPWDCSCAKLGSS